MDGPRQGTRWGMLAAVVAALVLASAVLASPAGTGRWGSIAGTAVPASSTTTPAPTSTPPVPPGQQTKVPGSYTLRLGDHPLLVNPVTLPSITCELPRFARDVDSLRAYYTQLRECLNAVWRPSLEAAGLAWSSPAIHLDSQFGPAFCGDPEDREFTAAYCPDGETMFFPVDRLIKVDRGGAAVHLGVFAHEYAHHIQATTGLLEAAFMREGEVGADTPAGQEISRRTELQADCFAGMFLAAAAGRGAISRKLADAAVGGFKYGSLPKTHGTSARQHAWARNGYQQRSTAACNTWTAPPAEVR